MIKPENDYQEVEQWERDKLGEKLKALPELPTASTNPYVENQAEVELERQKLLTTKREVIYRSILAPILTTTSLKAHNEEKKRQKSLLERKNFILSNFSNYGANIYQMEKEIKNFLEPVSDCEYWDSNFDLAAVDIKFICSKMFFGPVDTAVIVGESFAGKTHLASYLAICIMTGLPFLGMPIEGKGAVAHLNWDSNTGLTRTAYQQLANGMNATWSKDQLHYQYEPKWKLHMEIAYERLKEICIGRKLLIIDSLRKCYDGDENDAEIGSQIISLCNRVIQETGCAIILLGHCGKSGIGDKGIGSLRGTYAAICAAGTQWNLEKDKKDPRTITISCPKGRLGQFNTFQYCYQNAGNLLPNILKYSAIEMTFLGDPKAKNDLEMKIISHLEARPGHKDKRTAISKSLGVKAENAKPKIDKMLEEGKLTEEIDGNTHWIILAKEENNEQ